MIPKDAAKRLARIEAREGAPEPERWYLLVYEPADERGMREFVVAGGKLVTSRLISQFAETLTPEDVIGADAVKIDSTHIAKLASAFANAEGAKVGSLNYELTRDAESKSPVWRVTVMDAVGDQLGILTVDAAKGVVLGSDGFGKTPEADLLAPPAKVAIAERTAARRTKAASKPTPKPGLLKRIFSADRKSPGSDR